MTTDEMKIITDAIKEAERNGWRRGFFWAGLLAVLSFAAWQWYKVFQLIAAPSLPLP